MQKKRIGSGTEQDIALSGNSIVATMTFGECKYMGEGYDVVYYFAQSFSHIW